MGRGSGCTQGKRWSRWAEERLLEGTVGALQAGFARSGREPDRRRSQGGAKMEPSRSLTGGWGPGAGGGPSGPPEWAEPPVPPRRRRARSRPPLARRAGGARRGLPAWGPSSPRCWIKWPPACPAARAAGTWSARYVRQPRPLPGWEWALTLGLCACVLGGCGASSETESERSAAAS